MQISGKAKPARVRQSGREQGQKRDVVTLGTRLIFKRDRFHCLRCKQDFSARLFELTRHHMIPRNIRSLFDFEISDERMKILMRLRRRMKFQITLCLHCHEMIHELGERTFYYPNKRWHAKNSRIFAIAGEKPRYLAEETALESAQQGKPMIMIAEIMKKKQPILILNPPGSR